MANRNRKVVPSALKSLDRFKMEVAQELGIPLTEGYNGNLPSNQAGRIGGQMVRRMIEHAEQNLK